MTRGPDAGVGPVSGDLALVGPDLGIEIRASGPNEERGALVAVRQSLTRHDWEALDPRLAIDGVLYEPRVEQVRLARIGSRPAIVVEATVTTPRTQLVLQRVFRIADVRSALRISTQVRVVEGTIPSTVQVVERVAFGGGHPSAPMHGPLGPDELVDAEWIARAVGRSAIVLASLQGSVRLVGHSVDHGRTDLIRFTEVWLPTLPETGGRYSAEALLTASTSGVGQAVRALGWARGSPFVEALAQLSANPPDTQVEVSDALTGALVVSALPDDQRRAILPLPESATRAPLYVTARAGGVAASERTLLSGPPYQPVLLSIAESSTLSIAVSQAGTGEALPARVRILPLRGAEAVRLGPDWSAQGALDTLITARGRTRIRLPAGYYRVLVSHGPEWSVFDQSIELGVSRQLELHAQLERAIDPGAWVPCELHVHQIPSPDSQVTLEDRVASLVAEGIAFAVPTDHNHVTDLSAAIAAQPLWGMMSVPGVEVTTADPLFGHFNAYPYPLEPGAPGQGAPEHRGLTPAELFSSLHAVDPDLIVQVNHPRIEGGIGYFDVAEYDATHDHGSALWSDDFDALEVWNGFDLARWPNVQRVFQEWLSMIEHGHRIVATGSSDSHTIRSEGAGYPRTYVRAPLAGVPQGKQLIRALREGRAFVTSGPFLSAFVGEHGLGDTVPLDSPNIDVDVFVQIPAWMQLSTLRIYLGSTLLRSVALGSPSASSGAGRRYQRRLRVKVERPGPLVVSVEGDATLDPVLARRGVRPFAFTNPIWLGQYPAGPERSADDPAPPPEPLVPHAEHDAAAGSLEHHH